jgi:electron transfer flavoprotein beta subunit
MRIAVCIKQVPDSYAEKRMTDGRIDRAASDRVLNDLDEYAIETALLLAEAHPGTTVTAVSVGPDEASEAIRRALAMGANDAIHVSDPAIAGSDAPATARVLAATLKDRAFDIVMFGQESTDAKMGVVQAMVATLLDLPLLSFAEAVAVDAGSARITRRTEWGLLDMEAALPVAVAVVERIHEPRYPSFKGIMAARKAPLEKLDLAAIGIDAASVGDAGSRTVVLDAKVRPPRTRGALITDNGAQALADYLKTQKLV